MRHFCSWCGVEVQEAANVTALLTGGGTGKRRGTVIFCSEECLTMARRKLPCFRPEQLTEIRAVD